MERFLISTILGLSLIFSSASSYAKSFQIVDHLSELHAESHHHHEDHHHASRDHDTPTEHERQHSVELASLSVVLFTLALARPTNFSARSIPALPILIPLDETGQRSFGAAVFRPPIV